MERKAPVKVVIAGGGVAGLEAMLALRALAADRVWIDLVAPTQDFVYRPLSVLEPFGGKTPCFDLSQIVLEHGVRHRVDAVTEVDVDRRRVKTKSGKDIDYDMLIVAIGTRARDAIPGALTFGGDVSGQSFSVLVDELASGRVKRVAFALPSGVAWSLPIYELAFNMDSSLRERDASGFELTIVTPEVSPLIVFGTKASNVIRERLAEAGIELMTGTHPVAVEQGRMKVAPDGYVPAERVIALPRLEGLPPAGLPRDESGFIPINEHGQVLGTPNVYAAGDATTFPVKQGGMAAALADVVAEEIAVRCGAPITPSEFRPLLRGMLFAGDGAIYLSGNVTRDPASDSPTDTGPLWWPPPKISARYLAPYLAENETRLRRPESRAHAMAP
jgi:sulfide:quinone oxidoreductase